MNNDYLSKFYELGYTHSELEALLKKLSEGEVFTKEEHARLSLALGLIDGLSTFNGSYESLTDKPDILEVVRQSNEFVTFLTLNSKVRVLGVEIETSLKKIITDMMIEIEQSKADIEHRHDNRYSLLNHMHEGLYVTQEEMNNKNYVTKDYLDSILAILRPGGGSGGNTGGSFYPTYVMPTLVAKSDVSFIPHKKETLVTITPTFTQNDAGDIIKFYIKRNGETIYEGTEVKDYIDSVYLVHGESVNYAFVAEYGDGEIKNTITGMPYPDTMIKAGVITTGLTIKGRANSYYGVISDKIFEVNDISNLTSITNASKKYTANFIMDNQKSVYMYPESFGVIESIKDVNNFEYINSYTLIKIEYDDVLYNVYVLTDAVTVEGSFKQIFS